MAENKSKFTGGSVDDYIASRANAQQEPDCRELMALFRKITREKPRMWGPSIVGYGSYKYTNSSGRPTEVPVACFAIRGRDLVVYLYAEGPKQKSLLSKVGKHTMGKSCLRSVCRCGRSLLAESSGCIACHKSSTVVDGAKGMPTRLLIKRSTCPTACGDLDSDGYMSEN
jgi:hypothetical protein